MPIKIDSWDNLPFKELDEDTKENLKKYKKNYHNEVFDSFYYVDLKKIHYLLYELNDVKTFMKLLFYESSYSFKFGYNLGYGFENYNGKIILNIRNRDWLTIISNLLYKDFHKELCITGRWNLKRILILTSFFAEYLTEKDLDVILKKLPKVLKKYKEYYPEFENNTWLFLIQTFSALNKQEFVDKIYATMLFEENK